MQANDVQPGFTVSLSKQPITTASLKWINPQGGEQTYLLQNHEIVIGRKSDADIVLASPYVSRHHAKLIRGRDSYSITDLRSTGGTFVNGKRIAQQELHPGDRIGLGPNRIELHYLTETVHSAGTPVAMESEDLEKSFLNLTSILPSESPLYSDLEKISSILELQYQWGKTFSAEKTFEQILKSAMKVSGAERGYVLLKGNEEFDYVVGMDGEGNKLSQSDFRTSQSVARRVASEGKAVFMAEGIEGELAQRESVVALRLRSVACMPLRWMSGESDAPQVLGILYLDSRKRMRALSGLDEKILNKLAGEASNVFEKLEMIKTFEDRKSLELELALKQERQERLERELRAAEELRQAETRVLLSENAASMGRFAAALSHELNNPIGALKSALQTSQSMSEKKAALPENKRSEIEQMEAQLRHTSLQSAERLHQIVLRMQRFTNLDRDEVLSVDLNSLLQDVIDVLKAGIKGKVDLELNFQPLPPIQLRPQQISAVFLNLLQNAIEGLGGKGQVRVSTFRINSQLQATIQDDGKGLSAEELDNIFDPAFRVKSARVSTGNWSLFSSRQIVREHGGEIEIQSSPGKGTTVRVSLPCTPNLQA